MKPQNFRVGQGFDSHRYVDGRPLILGGVQIPYEQGLKGHSDADAAIHAVVDAILGAIGFGSIGQLFPPDDPKFKDADSKTFLLLVMKLLSDQHWQVVNLDLTIIAQQPRLQPFVNSMRATLAALINIQPESVSVKVKSAEHMGALGRVEGVAVLCNCLLYQDESVGETTDADTQAEDQPA